MMNFSDASMIGGSDLKFQGQYNFLVQLLSTYLTRGLISNVGGESYFDLENGHFNFQKDADNYLRYDGTNFEIKGSVTVTGGTATATFTSEPTTPYKIGDLWAEGSSGQLRICTTARATGAYVAGDWELATEYTKGADWATNLTNIPSTLGTPAGSGLFLSSTHLGFYDNPVWKTYMDSNGNFYLGGTSGKLIWNAGTNELSIEGSITVTGGNAATTDYADSVLSDFVSDTYTGDLSSLQTQIDGKVETWYYAYEPTLINIPASDWTTDAIKNTHLGDLFYNTATGYAYRFKVVTGTYSWERLLDSDITQALEDASNAQDTADHKRTVFTAEPTTPYYVGDLWLTSLTDLTGDFKKCVTEKLTGTYDAAHWKIATKYTDDTVASQALSDAANAQTAANNAQTSADTANGLLADLASDSKLTAVEKQQLKTEWDSIVSEVVLNDAQAILFGVTTEKTTYDNAYAALNTYLNVTVISPNTAALMADLVTTVTIVSATFRANFKAYYDARTALLNKIATVAKAAADLAQTNIDAESISTLQTTDAMVTSIGATCYDESPLEAEVKGLTLRNFLIGGNFPSTTGWVCPYGTLTVASNTATQTGSAVFNYPQIYQNTSLATASGKKIRVKLRYRVTNANCLQLYSYLDGTTGGTQVNAHSVNNPVQNQWYDVSEIITTPADFTGFYQLKIVHRYVDNATANGKVMEVQYVSTTDLSGDLGAGNEPATAADMDKIAPAWFDGTVSVVNPSMVNCGKNVAPSISASTYSGIYPASTTFGTNTITFDMNGGAGAGISSNEITVIENTNYILSLQLLNSLGTGQVVYRVYAEDNATILVNSATLTPTTGFTTFTSASFSTGSSSKVYIRVLRTNVNGLTSMTNVQLELGSTATTYEAYKSNTLALTGTLRSVFDTATLYRDRLYRESGVWKIDRYVNPSTGALQTMATEDAVITGNPIAYKNGTIYYNTTVIAPRTEYTYALNFRGAYNRAEEYARLTGEIAKETVFGLLDSAGQIAYAKLGTTIIDGGYLQTVLIKANQIQTDKMSSVDGLTYFDLDNGEIFCSDDRSTINRASLFFGGVSGLEAGTLVIGTGAEAVDVLYGRNSSFHRVVASGSICTINGLGAYNVRVFEYDADEVYIKDSAYSVAFALDPNTVNVRARLSVGGINYSVWSSGVPQWNITTTAAIEVKINPSVGLQVLWEGNPICGNDLDGFHSNKLRSVRALAGTPYTEVIPSETGIAFEYVDGSTSTLMSLSTDGTLSGLNEMYLNNFPDTADAATHYYVETASGNLLPKTLANVRTEILGLSGSASYDPASIAAGGYLSNDFTLTGAALGDMVVGSTNVSLQNLVVSWYVVNTDTVRVVLYNPTASAINIGNSTWKYRIIKQ